MLKKVGIVLIALFMMGCATLSHKIYQSYDLPANVVSWAKTNAYKVITRQGSGSGFWINEHHLVTNCHVVDGYDNVVVQNWNQSKVIPMEVATCDYDRDLALLTYFDNDVVTPGSAPTTIYEGVIPMGTAVWGLGYPLGGPLHITQGHKTAVSDWNQQWDQISTPTIMGDSGSAGVTIIDGEVVVVGVRARVASVPQQWFHSFLPHIALMINTNTIWSFFKDE
jgi:S1-C subfamily serine protease